MDPWDEFLQEYPECADLSPFTILTENAVIVKRGNKWCIISETGKNLGCKPTRPAAEKRLKQIEMFKHMKNKGTAEEFAKAECECGACGAIFYTPQNCNEAVCPVCHEQDDIYDL